MAQANPNLFAVGGWELGLAQPLAFYPLTYGFRVIDSRLLFMLQAIYGKARSTWRSRSINLHQSPIPRRRHHHLHGSWSRLVPTEQRNGCIPLAISFCKTLPPARAFLNKARSSTSSGGTRSNGVLPCLSLILVRGLFRLVVHFDPQKISIREWEIKCRNVGRDCNIIKDVRGVGPRSEETFDNMCSDFVFLNTDGEV